MNFKRMDVQAYRKVLTALKTDKIPDSNLTVLFKQGLVPETGVRLYPLRKLVNQFIEGLCLYCMHMDAQVKYSSNVIGCA